MDSSTVVHIISLMVSLLEMPIFEEPSHQLEKFFKSMRSQFMNTMLDFTVILFNIKNLGDY